VRHWMTSCMSVLGLRERIMLGESSPLKDAESALDSVPGSDDSGRTLTSTVALDGCSAAKRTSMGPETEARDCVSPLDTNENMGHHTNQDVPKPNRADPSTLSSLS
jgi:hypothetical protein